jgi:hypothetical protein
MSERKYIHDAIRPNKLLEAAKGKVPVAIIIGLDADGELYFASSTGAVDTIHMILDKAKAYAERNL